MPVRLSTITVSKIASLSNSTNAALLTKFYQYMKDNGASESHTNNSRKLIWHMPIFLVQTLPFMTYREKNRLLHF
jgi:hypothetical protein